MPVCQIFLQRLMNCFEAEQKLSSGIVNLENKKYELEAKYEEGLNKFDKYYSKLVQKKAEIEENNLKLNKGKDELEDAKEKFPMQIAKFLTAMKFYLN